MEYKEIINKIKPEMEKVLSFLEGEMNKIQAGRASASLVEDIMVESYGQKLSIKQLSAISCPGPREIVIQPWDKSSIEEIVKSITKSSIGAAPIVNEDLIRLTLPSLTEELRKDLLRVLSEKQEEARRTIRHWREQAWKEVQTLERESEISEDDKYRAKDDLQELIDDYNKKIEELGDRKKKEIEN
jgi:ribosome recycling factor